MSQNEKKYVEKVLNKYTDKKVTKLDELRNLDKLATKPANVFASIFGSISTLIMGFGMCIALEAIFPGYMWLGIIIGVIGIVLVLVNYPLYKKILAASKAKYKDQIQALSDELLNK